MKLTKLHLIIILALTLILCPILGVCNNARNSFQENMKTEQKMEIEEGFADDEEEGVVKVQEGLYDTQEGSEEGFNTVEFGQH